MLDDLEVPPISGHLLICSLLFHGYQETSWCSHWYLPAVAVGSFAKSWLLAQLAPSQASDALSKVGDPKGGGFSDQFRKKHWLITCRDADEKEKKSKANGFDQQKHRGYIGDISRRWFVGKCGRLYCLYR